MLTNYRASFEYESAFTHARKSAYAETTQATPAEANAERGVLNKRHKPKDRPRVTNVVPVILAGGTGTRLWPLSRQSYPKQFLPMSGTRTLLQDTATRALPVSDVPPLVLANSDHRFIVAEQLHALGIRDARIVLEPLPRNTAPAIAIAAMVAIQETPDAILLVMPADHVLPDAAAFQAAVATALPAAQDGRLVLFGIRPSRPETGYGYIRAGQPLPHDGVDAVASFAEKPDRLLAEAYLARGGYLWNSGIFLLPASVLIQEMQTYQPEIVDAARRALADATVDRDFIRLSEGPFAKSPSISIDYAVLEKTHRAAVVPVDLQWSDAGTWSSLWEMAAKDEQGNVQVGDTIALESRNSYLRSNGPIVAAVGVHDLVIVATADAVLVTTKAADQNVSNLVALLKRNGSRAATEHVHVHRPWGSYQVIDSGERFQVKRITVNPDARLSLQKHRHRSEHWVVVNGTAFVTRDDEQLVVHENESVYLPLGCIHRLENRSERPLNLIEVQSGSYLGEDDIVRLEDDFGRIAHESQPNTATTTVSPVGADRSTK